ncbi:MAG: hypothetical protein AAED33_12735 [Paracoccaceae bacterium]|jgi:hypothetical protein
MTWKYWYLFIGVLIFTPVVTHADVRCVQEFLSETPFDPGPIDGMWGRKTSSALTGFFEQTGENIDGGFGKSNTDAVCSLFQSERRSELLASVAYRIYPIEIDPKSLSVSGSQTAFDFSNSNIAKNLYSACSFSIDRLVKHDGRVEQLATGKLEINAGRIEFGKHRWRTKGLADESYLLEEANLAVSESGMVIGKTPYFHLFVGPGEIDQQPLYVTLSSNFESSSDFPNGNSIFLVNNWQDGMLRLYYCDLPE